MVRASVDEKQGQVARGLWPIDRGLSGRFLPSSFAPSDGASALAASGPFVGLLGARLRESSERAGDLGERAREKRKREAAAREKSKSSQT